MEKSPMTTAPFTQGSYLYKIGVCLFATRGEGESIKENGAWKVSKLRFCYASILFAEFFSCRIGGMQQFVRFMRVGFTQIFVVKGNDLRILV